MDSAFQKSFNMDAKRAIAFFKRFATPARIEAYNTRRQAATQAMGNDHEKGMVESPIYELRRYLDFFPGARLTTSEYSFYKTLHSETLKEADKKTNIQYDSIPEAVSSIESNLLFLEKFLDQCRLDDHLKSNLRGTLVRLRSKNQDPRLFMGILGQISTGKSTFVNALIRDDLLRTDVLQATTSATTIITYGQELGTLVIMRTDAGESFQQLKLPANFYLQRFFRMLRPISAENFKDDFRFFLETVSANEAVAKRISSVIIEHPSKILQNRLVVVDTPGIDAGIARHEDVTRVAVRDVCDAAVIIIPADAPGADSLYQFIEQNLQEQLHRCVFVITKIDLITRESERDRIVHHVKRTVAKRFDISSPIVYTAAPRVYMDVQAGVDPNLGRRRNLDLKSIRIFVEEFEETRNYLLEFMEKQRQFAICEKLSATLKDLYSKLSSQLEVLEREVSEKQQKLENEPVKDIQEFIHEQKAIRITEFKSEVHAISHRLKKKIIVAKSSLKEDIRGKIFAAGSRGDLEKVKQKRVPQLFRKNVKQLSIEINQELCLLMRKAEEQHDNFKESFVKHYKNLEMIGGEIPVTKKHLRSPALTPTETSVIGKILNWFNSLEKLKAAEWKEIESIIDKKFETFKKNSANRFEQLTYTVESELVGLIARYEKRSRRIVKRMLKEHTEALEKFRKSRTDICRHQHQIMARIDQVEENHRVIRHLSGAAN